MSTQKTTAKEAPLQSTKRDATQANAADAKISQLKVLSLELEDDNLGADPYNRTGSFCQLDLKDRE